MSVCVQYMGLEGLCFQVVHLCACVVLPRSTFWGGCPAVMRSLVRVLCARVAAVHQMSYTRRLWNDMLLCRRAKVDSIELLLVASFLTLLPITFYVASYINSPDISSNILQRESSKPQAPPYLTNLQHKLLQYCQQNATSLLPPTE